MASAPLEEACPGCKGARTSFIRAKTLLLAALATRHLSVQPMAIGEIPPSFLLRPSKVAPNKDDLMSACTAPDKMKLTKDVRACKSCWPPSLADLLVNQLNVVGEGCHFCLQILWERTAKL